MQVPVTAAALAEARDALRAAEQRRGLQDREIEPARGPVLGPESDDAPNMLSDLGEVEQ